MFKIEIEEIPITTEISMEKQKIGAEPAESFKKIHYSLIIFMIIQVLWLLAFSEPLTLLVNQGQPLIPILSDDIISRTARYVMIYHSLAVPFLVANTFWILEFYPVRKRWIPTLKVLLLPGTYLVGISGLIFAYTRIRVFHEIFYFGLFMVFLGGIIFIISVFPIPGKFPDPRTNPSGSTINRINLEYMNLVILAICVMVSTIMAAIAALENFTGTIWGLGREPEAFLAEAIIRRHPHDVVEDFIVSHLHIQLAQSAAMVLMVGYRTSKMSGKAYTYTLIANAIGVIVISYGSWVLDHYTIWVGAGILIICTLALAIVGWKKLIRDNLKERYATTTRWGKIKGLFKDPVNFTYFYLILFSHIFVTITGIIVGLQVDSFYRLQETLELEYDFNVGHWHVLSVLIAIVLMLKSIDFFNISGKQRKILGWGYLIGSTLAFSGADIYMLRPLPAENVQPGLTIMFTGVWFLIISVIWAIIAITKKYRRELSEKKLSKLLILERAQEIKP
ncbi:MAG: hypothetical protein ACFFD7_04230 [Candidatus Thorarchaeota archaeon]